MHTRTVELTANTATVEVYDGTVLVATLEVHRTDCGAIGKKAWQEVAITTTPNELTGIIPFLGVPHHFVYKLPDDKLRRPHCS